MQKVVTENTWITKPEALKILQVSAFTFRGLVLGGRIRQRDHGRRRYWREDVERLASPPDAA
jgi:hypothetical protein